MNIMFVCTGYLKFWGYLICQGYDGITFLSTILVQVWAGSVVISRLFGIYLGTVQSAVDELKNISYLRYDMAESRCSLQG